ncbi:unnamed protein product [Brassica rapa]|uniref:Uncharacterized protein n=1 Tax=Brassica campestris TaxID=3711 RepID=A0A8D9CNJ8_BRACM|nr:unnamed protein product [Brassica rapa]
MSKTQIESFSASLLQELEELKKLQGQVTPEQDKGTPTKHQSAKKSLKVSTNKRFGSSPQTPRSDSPHSAKSFTSQSRHA